VFIDIFYSVIFSNVILIIFFAIIKKKKKNAAIVCDKKDRGDNTEINIYLKEEIKSIYKKNEIKDATIKKFE
jgi:hypothetical protein